MSDFISKDICKIETNDLRLYLSNYQSQKSCSKITLDNIRRIMAIEKGMPIKQVQKLLGHTKIDTTLHYALVNQVSVKKVR